MKLLEIIEKYLIYISLFLLPIIFIPFFSSSYDTPKLLLLIVSSVLIILVKLLKIILNKSFEFSSNKYDLVMISISIVYLISTFLMTANKTEGFFLPGVTSFIILSTIFYFFVNQLKSEDRQNLIYIFLASSLIISITQIFSFLKVFTWLPESTTGSLITSALFLVAMLPFIIHDLIVKGNFLKKILITLVGLFLVAGTFISIYSLVPNKDTSSSILSHKVSWQITADSIKISPFLGVGPANHIDAFNKYKPLSFNSTKEWNQKYILGASSLLTVATETGLLGISLFLILFLLIFKNSKPLDPYHISIIILFAGIALFPILFSFLPIIFVIISLENKNIKRVSNKFNSDIPSFLIAIPLFLLVVFISYVFTRTTLAEIEFSKSLKSISAGDGLKTYEQLNSAIKLNPYSDRYHLVAAEINLKFAQNLSKKGDLTDEEKQTFTKLIQQTIVEGKASVNLNNGRASNWESLSTIYISIIPFAKDADTYAIQTLNQAIFLEPINPNLRIKLGGIYYSQGKYDEAIEVFRLAVLAKSDYANSHYNLSMAYKEKKDLVRAKDEMNIVLELVGKDTKDYELALKELEKIDELTKPEAIPEPVIEPQIELPIDNQNNEG
jgi:tetratricopeptide (TPR) repeat protein